MSTTESTKICVACGKDCAHAPRTKDAKGRYFCKPCYERAAAKASGAVQAAVGKDAHYGLEPVEKVAPRAPTATGGPTAFDPKRMRGTAMETPVRGSIPPAMRGAASAGSAVAVDACPSCELALVPGTIICVPCGINVVSGRSILTAEQGDTDQMHEHARGIFWFVSWILILGLMPFSSEAHGSYKPWAVRFLVAVTVFTSMWMWWFEWTDSPNMHQLKNLLLWVGDEKPDTERIEAFYQLTSFGDRKAFAIKKFELRDAVPGPELANAALEALPKSKQCFGEFHWWQLLTCAFLHGGFLHLGGNLVFMIVFGSRINALIGNIGTLIIYPILAICSSLPDLLFMSDSPPTPTLGASGAIMGLAGMYFVLFPVCKVHVAAFIRIPILLLAIFRCRGIWVLLVYFLLDVISTVLGAEDGVAHWAHMGGFLVGAAIALALLVTRGVNARGNDLVSVLLGRHAWALLGRPSQWAQQPGGEGWLTRLRILPEGSLTRFESIFARRSETDGTQA